VNLVLAVLRAAQVWAGRAGALPGLRAAIAARYGLDEKALLAAPGAPADAGGLVEVADGPHVPPPTWSTCSRRWRAGSSSVWRPSAGRHEGAGRLRRGARVARAGGRRLAGVRGARGGAAARRHIREIDAVLHALDGGYVPAGPSGSADRGLVNVLPTGRNFLLRRPEGDPVPQLLEVGASLAASLVERHLRDTGEYPRSVGLTVWGTSAMRTQGDDIAEVLALIGVRPVWDEASRRVTGFEIISREELGRPRIDVTLRISGSSATRSRTSSPSWMTRSRPSPSSTSRTTICAPTPWRTPVRTVTGGARTSRIFGSKPGAYGAGLLPLIDSR